jgi:hypothetical protein
VALAQAAADRPTARLTKQRRRHIVDVDIQVALVFSDR